jgi:hypothetical protein
VSGKSLSKKQEITVLQLLALLCGSSHSIGRARIMIAAMSRLRRLVVSDRWFFVTGPTASPLAGDSEWIGNNPRP